MSSGPPAPIRAASVVLDADLGGQIEAARLHEMNLDLDAVGQSWLSCPLISMTTPFTEKRLALTS